MSTIPELFGSMVFDDKVMRARLSADVYHSLKETIRRGKKLDLSVANAVADAMCAWAVERGATHFTHWFQPLTGITAEKHESFLSPAPDSHVIMKFSGKELIQGEPDASSFPSGGLRATFEARGYTAWDPTSYAFIKEKTLCIPTAFCSYGGEALDKKTPLLRSMEALNRQSLRVLRLFGNREVQRVVTNVGPEQEYFLVDRDMYLKRRDLIYTGRTLFGAKPPKGQELEDHYFGAIKPRVKAFMEELNEELWKLGIYAKTEHNEVAPCQHELAPIFTVTNVAADHNQLTMEIMKKVARRHGLVCLLHEKPFAGVNGSGKHNNWSMATDTGVNLLCPGDTPYENAQFLLFLLAVIKAVDEYQGLLRLSVASAGNDHRLGANEAPPAVISIFLGDELSAVLDAIETDSPYAGTEKRRIRLGADVLPRFNRDTTDRNRTSPFAFTGNKFEFRMVGANDSISCANIMINAAVAEALRQFADALEGCTGDFDTRLHELIRENIKAHKRILFNGNGYDDAWIKEATEQRGLLNLRTTPDALQMVLVPENMEMLQHHKIFSEAEIRSRYEITMENYVRTVRIEALTMVDMARKEILPAVLHFTGDLASEIGEKKKAVAVLPCRAETKLLEKLSGLADEIDAAIEALEESINSRTGEDITAQAFFIRDALLGKMDALRALCDKAETLTAASYWPFPTYGDLLFGV
ncbi:MAG: glutamine synthetase III [Oscillospiraceae bacterium]|nr:glutamine synthetase III [Oscillospiraceae bacterium]